MAAMKTFLEMILNISEIILILEQKIFAIWKREYVSFVVLAHVPLKDTLRLMVNDLKRQNFHVDEVLNFGGC